LGGAATKEDRELIETLFGAIGKVWRADEKLFDAIAALRYVGFCDFMSIMTVWAQLLIFHILINLYMLRLLNSMLAGLH